MSASWLSAASVTDVSHVTGSMGTHSGELARTEQKPESSVVGSSLFFRATARLVAVRTVLRDQPLRLTQ